MKKNKQKPKEVIMKLQEILNQTEIQQELDEHMRESWDGIPENFKPKLDLSKPYSLQDLTQVNIIGINNYSNETITIKELNFLFIYCFVMDFNLFYFYERAKPEEKWQYCFPTERKVFMKFSRLANIQELQWYARGYKDELENYINITGRRFIYSILD